MKHAPISSFREKARNVLSGQWGTAALLILVSLVLMYVCVAMIYSFLFGAVYLTQLTGRTSSGLIIFLLIVYVALIIFMQILMASINFVHFNWYMTGKIPNVLDAFPFAFKHAWGIFKLGFLIGLFTALWSLLFYIPGIIKTFSYSQGFYIYFERLNNGENPKEIRAMDCITQSRKLMNGQKGRLFLLELSFIGWGLLAILTLGIGMLWLLPYILMAQVAFYVGLKGSPENKTEPLMDNLNGNGATKSGNPIPEDSKNLVGEPIKAYPSVENSLYEEVMGTNNQSPRPHVNWVIWVVGGVVTILVVIALGYVISQVTHSARQIANNRSEQSSKKVTNASSSQKRADEAQPHNGITPVKEFTDGYKNSDPAQRSVTFDPASNKVELGYESNASILDSKEIKINWQNDQWLDSKVAIDKAYIVKIPVKKLDVGSGKERAGGLVVFDVTVKTGKYDNDYYPAQMKLLTNLGTAYDPHYISGAFDGGVPYNSSRGENVFVFLPTLTTVDSIKSMTVSFDANAADVKTQAGDNSNYNYGFSLNHISGTKGKVKDNSREN